MYSAGAPPAPPLPVQQSDFQQFIKGVGAMGDFPDVAKIKAMTELARALRATHGRDVVEALFLDAMPRAPPSGRVPLLYLVDSVMKNVGGGYTVLASQFVVHAFCESFDIVGPDDRVRLFRMLRTWEKWPLFEHQLPDINKFVHPWVVQRQQEEEQQQQPPPPRPHHHHHHQLQQQQQQQPHPPPQHQPPRQYREHQPPPGHRARHSWQPHHNPHQHPPPPAGNFQPPAKRARPVPPAVQQQMRRLLQQLQQDMNEPNPMTLEELWHSNPQLALQIQATAEQEVAGEAHAAAPPLRVGGLYVDTEAARNLVMTLQQIAVAGSPIDRKQDGSLRAASIVSNRLAQLLFAKPQTISSAQTVRDLGSTVFSPDRIDGATDDAAVAQLFDRKFMCEVDGLRFQTREQLAEHEEVVRQRTHERTQQPTGMVYRAWFPTSQQWETDFAHESAAGPSTESVHAAPQAAPSPSPASKATALSVAVNEAVSKCRICGEPFELSWNDDAEEWVYRDAVEVRVASGLENVAGGPKKLVVHSACSVIASEDGTVDLQQLLPTTPNKSPTLRRESTFN